MRQKKNISLLLILALTGCSSMISHPAVIPAVEYAKRIDSSPTPPYQGSLLDDGRGGAKFQFVSNVEKPSVNYKSPLSLGEPGISASLWNESRGDNDLFRDGRAWRPMDLVTILISENSEGSKSADTEVKSKSTIQIALEKLFGYETDATKSRASLDPTALVQGDVQNDFKGEGKTNRKGALKATISAMVAEVLPSGILRVEGQKIISVNNEEQVLVISGLVRPRDVTSDNEVDSRRVANMRIDFYGQGTIGEAQYGGWLGRLLRVIWPF